MDAAPPTSHWEIPRTPPTRAVYVPPSTQAANGATSSVSVTNDGPVQTVNIALSTAHCELPPNPPGQTEDRAISVSSTTSFLKTRIQILSPSSRQDLPRTHGQATNNTLSTTFSERQTAPMQAALKTAPTTTTTDCEINGAPPTSHWEIPRIPLSGVLKPVVDTPIQVVDIGAHSKRGGVAMHTEAVNIAVPAQHSNDSAPPTSHWAEICRTPPSHMVKASLANNILTEKASANLERTVTCATLPNVSRTSPAQPFKSVTAISTTRADVSSTSDREEHVVSAEAVNEDLKALSTSHWEIPRTPPGNVAPPPHKEVTSRVLTTAVPPSMSSHWELPRTLVETPHFESVQLSPKKGPSCTPTRTRVPLHPLSFSTSVSLRQSYPSPSSLESPLKLASSGRSTSPARDEHCAVQSDQVSAPAANLTKRQEKDMDISPPILTSNRMYCRNTELLVCHSILHVMIFHKSVIHVLPVPPSFLAAGLSSLCGLQCTDEDLAFLQRRNNLKQYKKLQLQSERLAREEKAAKEEKELLEHTALKVQKDIDTIQSKYQETVSTINALITDPNILATSGGGGDGGKLPLSKSEASPACKDLAETDVTQLKKLNKLTVSQVDRLDKKLKERRAELDAAKLNLHEQLK